MPQAVSLQPGPRPPVPAGPVCWGPGARQGGAALMVLLIILVVATSAVILAKIDPTRHELVRETQTSEALVRAKDYLMAWGVTLPERPGGLPYPDRADDAPGYDGRGDCVTGGPSNAQLIGRFPWQGQDGCEVASHGLDISDGYGARLWYAVSRNLVRNPGAGAAPINSNLVDLDPPPFPWLQVRDGQGNVVSDRVAAVIIAPGPALAGQDRSGATPAIENFLETFVDPGGDTVGNTGNDGCPDDGPAPCGGSEGEDFYIHQSDEFNDRLIFITIDELMPRVERRVALEAARILREFKQNDAGQQLQNRFPWLAPFANPLVRAPIVHGDHDGAEGTTLVDNSKDFEKGNVRANDLLWNVTGETTGEVTARNSATSLDTVLAGGAVFDDDDGGDDYQIAVTGLNHTGTAGGGNNVTDALQDISAHFWSVLRPGALVRNVTDGSAAMVGAVPVTGTISDTLSFAALTGGTENDFDTGDVYRVEMDHGTATGGSATSLVDTEADFELLDVRARTPVLNLTDGSAARVTGVTNATTLALSRLRGGVDNDFDNGDVYRLGRFDGRVGTRFGQLPIHVLGGPYRSGFQVAWTLRDGSYGFSDPLPSPDPLVHSESMRVASRDTAVATGTATAGSGGLTLEDTATDFFADGVALGDAVIVDHGAYGTITAMTATTLTVGGLTGVAPLTFAVDDGYTVHRVHRVGDDSGVCVWDRRAVVRCMGRTARTPIITGIATGGGPATLEDLSEVFSAVGDNNLIDPTDDVTRWRVKVLDKVVRLGTVFATAGSAGDILEDAGADFVAAGLVVGDTVTNLTDGSSGPVTAVPAPGLGNDTLEVALAGGAANAFAPGDEYILPDDANAGVITGVFPHTVDVVGLATGFSDGHAYRILLAANGTALLVAGPGTTNTLLEAAPGDSLPMDLAEGDVLKKEIGTVDEYGFITDVSGLPTEVGVRMLDGGTLAPGDSYEIRYDLVAERAYEFRLEFAGAAAVPGSDPAALDLGYADAKTRDVLLLNANHVTPPGATGLRIRVLDYQAGGTSPLGDVALAANDNITATFLVRGIHMDLEQGVELPDWFMDNEWYRFLYAAAAAEEMPDGAGDCAGACLSIQDTEDNPLRADVEAVVIATGSSLAGDDRVLGEKGTANGCTTGGGNYLCHYLDPPFGIDLPASPSLERNDNGNDVFVRNNAMAVFNDVLVPVCVNNTNPGQEDACDLP